MPGLELDSCTAKISFMGSLEDEIWDWKEEHVFGPREFEERLRHYSPGVFVGPRSRAAAVRARKKVVEAQITSIGEGIAKITKAHIVDESALRELTDALEDARAELQYWNRR